MKSKLSTAKKSKITTFSRVFHPKKIDNFHGKSTLNFWTKNEDFEQCAVVFDQQSFRDVTCKKCNTKLGWVYEFATEDQQKYKEGKVILERALVTEMDGLDGDLGPDDSNE